MHDSGKDDENEEEDEYDDSTEDDMHHEEIVQGIIDEAALAYPIMYDVYDLCSYVREDKLAKFTVPVLNPKIGMIFFSVPITHVVHECSCFN